MENDAQFEKIAKGFALVILGISVVLGAVFMTAAMS